MEVTDWRTLRLLAQMTAALATWPLLAVVLLTTATRPDRIASGPPDGVVRMSLAAATLASLPMLIWLLVLLPPYSAVTSFWFALGLTAVSALGVRSRLGRTRRGPLTARPVARHSPFDRDLRSLSNKLDVDPDDVCRLVADDGTVHPGFLIGVSSSTGVFVAEDELTVMLTQGEGHARLVTLYAPGEWWWQMALAPMAAVSASLASAFLSLGKSAAVGVAVFLFAKWLVNRAFRRGRMESPQYYMG